MNTYTFVKEHYTLILNIILWLLTFLVIIQDIIYTKQAKKYRDEIFDLECELDQCLTRKMIFVSSDGDDNNNGLTDKTPFATMKKALQKINEDRNCQLTGKFKHVIKHISDKEGLKCLDEKEFITLNNKGGSHGSEQEDENLEKTKRT